MVTKAKPEQQPDPAEFAKIADSIGRVSDAARALRASGLSRDAAVVLIKHATGIPMKDVSAVLTAAEDLKRWCLTQR